MEIESGDYEIRTVYLNDAGETGVDLASKYIKNNKDLKVQLRSVAEFVEYYYNATTIIKQTYKLIRADVG